MARTRLSPFPLALRTAGPAEEIQRYGHGDLCRHVRQGSRLGIAPTGNALTVTAGAIVPQPCLTNGHLENREHLCLTISLDLSVIDGAPAAPFMQQLKELIEESAVG